MKIEVALVVRGGVVQTIYASVPDQEFKLTIFDTDDLREEGIPWPTIDADIEAKTNHLFVVY